MQVLRANPNIKSFGQRINEGLGAGLDTLQQYQQMAEEQEQQQQKQIRDQKFADEVKRLYDIDVSGLPLEEMSKFALEGFKGQQNAENAGKKLREEKKGEITSLQGALSSVDEMMKIRRKGNLGLGTSFRELARGETSKDVGAYQTLGNSLISFASKIPVRNQKEFEKLTGNISDPYISDKEAEGILTRLKKIINDSMMEYEEEETPSQNVKTEKKPLSAFRKN